jgi:hypothetical protein
MMYVSASAAQSDACSFSSERKKKRSEDRFFYSTWRLISA